jgi:hypothetical protein
MPLMKYFAFVGSTLLFILFGLDWYLPQPASLPIRADVDKSVIRISSVDQLPEKIIIDTNQPTTIPAPPVVELPNDGLGWPCKHTFGANKSQRIEYAEPCLAEGARNHGRTNF